MRFPRICFVRHCEEGSARRGHLIRGNPAETLLGSGGSFLFVRSFFLLKRTNEHSSLLGVSRFQGRNDPPSPGELSRFQGLLVKYWCGV